MPIGKTSGGKTIFASGRDVGNIAAGKVAGMRGISLNATLAVTDLYEIYTCLREHKPIKLEGPSTKSAQIYGHPLGEKIHTTMYRDNFKVRRGR